MNHARRGPPALFRIWVVRYDSWRPSGWTDLPPRATAVEPAEKGAFSATDAVRFLEGFNGAMLVGRDRLWAVAVPVRLRFEGDLRVGQTVSPKESRLLGWKKGGRG